MIMIHHYLFVQIKLITLSGFYCNYEWKLKLKIVCLLFQDIKETQELMDAREAAYTDYISESAAKYAGVSKQAQHVANTSSGGGLFGGLGKLFG
jgi:hypothetical protein